MGRIVPNTYKREDSQVVKALGEFVVNLPPQWVSPTFGDRFEEFVEQCGARLRDVYGLQHRDAWGPIPATRRPPPAGGGSGTDYRLSYVFYEKMSDRLRSLLVGSNLAMPDPVDSRWFGMHPRLADVYVTAMADQLAADQGFYPVTDETLDHVAVGGWTMERLAQALLPNVELVDSAPTSREVEAVAAYVAIETVIPKAIETVPVDTLLKFREKYPQERATFQRYVREFVKPREWLDTITTTDALERRLQSEYEKDLKPRVQELREKYEDVGIGTATSAMTISVRTPSLVTQGAAALGLVANPIGGFVAGLALALIPVLRDRRKREQELRTSDVAYLMRLEQDLRPRKLIDWVKSAAGRFRLPGVAAPAP